MKNLNLKKLQELFRRDPAIKLIYLFGSQADQSMGPMSDFDFAVYFDDNLDKGRMFDLMLKLNGELSKLFGTDRIDVVVLNTSEMPELKYNIITQGKLIYEQEPYRVSVEPRILSEYFDFYYLLKKYGLTNA